MHELKNIETPDDWSAAKDLEHYEERWGESNNYARDVFEWFNFHYDSLNEVVNSAIDLLYRHEVAQIAIHPDCLSLEEKLEHLFRIAKALKNGKFRMRLLDDVTACRWVERERRRILAAYRAAGENGWLFPVIEIIDYIGWAAAILEDTMRCGEDDSFPFK